MINKKLILFILIGVFSAVTLKFALPKGLSELTVPKFAASKSTAALPSLSKSKESQTEIYLEGPPSLESIESDYHNLTRPQLESVISSIDQDLLDKQMILRANAGSLSKQEREFLAIQLRKQAVIRKILVERELDNLEREGS